MDIIRCVPPEIIRAIIVAAGVNDRIKVLTWKKALSFLWVCREWRIVAEPMLFSTLVCENQYEHGFATNSVFLLQRRCFDKVKQIIIREEIECFNGDESKYDLDVCVLKCLGELLDGKDMEEDMELLEVVQARGVIIEECRVRNSRYYFEKGISDVSYGDDDDDDDDKYDDDEYYTIDYYDRKAYNINELCEICDDTSKKIVSRVAALLPNITHLMFDSKYLPLSIYMLADGLLDNYTKQLVKLECSLPNIVYALKNCRNIQSITLKNYDSSSQQFLQLPPHRVKNISLEFDGDFSWSLFKCGDSLPVSYDNLTRLDIGGDDNTEYRIMSNISSPARSAEKPPLVVFPKLRVLSIRNRILSNSSLKHFLQFPVKLLRVEGRIHQLYQIYEQNLENLDQLVLKLRYSSLDEDSDGYGEEGEDIVTFVQLSNSLFAKTFNISEVHCTLVLNNLVMDWTNINWVYLTHLYVSVDGPAGQVIGAIPKCPNIIYLNITINLWNSGDTIDSLIDSIYKLRTNCTEQFQSNITRIEVKGSYHKRVPELLCVLEYLKCYLPKLKSFGFIDTEVC